MMADDTPRNDRFTLTRGHLYRIRSRNLPYGVYNGRGGFIGIREKFDSLYLFTEYDYDRGAPYGTVIVQEDLGPVPDDIEPVEAWWIREEAAPWPVGMSDPEPDPEGARGRDYMRNQALYDFLANAEKQYGRGTGYGGRPGDDPAER